MQAGRNVSMEKTDRQVYINEDTQKKQERKKERKIKKKTEEK